MNKIKKLSVGHEPEKAGFNGGASLTPSGSSEPNLDFTRFDLMVISKIPTAPEDRKIQGAFVNARLMGLLKRRLSPEESALYQQIDSSASEVRIPPGILSKFDEILIQTAATIGWRILISDQVLFRIQKWHDTQKNGPEMLARFAAAITTSARVIRGEERHPLDSPELPQSRREALEEVRVLCRKLNTRLNAQASLRNKLPSRDELYEIIRTEISAVPHTYPFLKGNTTSLFSYLALQDLDQDNSFTINLVMRGRGATPADLVNGWFDWGFATAQGKSRQIISRLKTRKNN